MKCEGCGAELADGAKTCSACGREVGLGHRAGAETEHVARETGAMLGKAGRGLVGGLKGFASGAKKGVKGDSQDAKQDEAKT
jgi:hypothetical protein